MNENAPITSTIVETDQSITEIYREGFLRKILTFSVMLVLLVLAALYSGAVGSANLSIQDVFLAITNALAPGLLPAPSSDIAQIIVLNIRMPRILLAVVTGISLAISGAVMQGTLRNPLVSPFTLGLSSAASFGAALAIVAGPGIFGPLFASNQQWFLIFAAFTFGLSSMVLVYLISRLRGDQSTLILAGVVIGYIFSAGVMVLKYLTNNEKLREITTWLMGGMWGASWDAVLILIPVTLVGFVLLVVKGWDLNAMTAGDEVAKNLGVKVERLRIYCLVIATVIASACLAFTGIIGFIGLMAPHICRMIIGDDYRYVIPCSALMGAIILLLSDTFARTIMSPVELPVGIVMYVIGGVFFLYLILKGQDRKIT